MAPVQSGRSPGVEYSDEQSRRRETERDRPRGLDRDGERSRTEQDTAKPSIFRNWWVRIGGVAAVVVLLVGGLLWWLNARNYVSTDDAFIDTHIVQISPQISGQVIRVAVGDNQLVKKGQLLVLVQPADMQARLDQAQSQENVAETQYRQAVANEAGASAQALNAEHELARYRLLRSYSTAAVAQEQIDQAVAADRNAIAQRDAARAQIAGAQAQIKLVKAQVAAARLNLGYTRITAPLDGHIAQRTVAVGNYVSPGEELMAVVPLKLWVTANFKETELAHMRPGQPVTLSVDACGGADVRGHVDSIQRGAGQAFGVLPPENATGNYVKVVQRVPVKIVLDKVPRSCPLGPGMSVEPSVKVR